MHISAVGFNTNTNFRGDIDDITDARYEIVPKVSKRDFSLDSVNFDAVSKTLDKTCENKRTSPTRYFISSIALTLAAFFASKAACYAAFNKLDNKFGMFESMGKKAGNALVKYVEKHPHREGKGVGIYFSNKMRDLAQGIINYGKKGLSADAIKGLDKAKLAGTTAGEAIKKGSSVALGIGMGGATIQSRYKDADNNGVPDKAEGAMSTIREVATLVPALVDAAGL